MNVLVMGPAKTGTTVVSEAIARAVGARRYISEPASFQALDTAELARAGGVVVKIIFEHWRTQPNLRKGLVRNETELAFDKRVLMVRDPRDELLSRLHFMVKPLLDTRPVEDARLVEWVDLFRRKEAAPASISVRKMVEECARILGADGLDDIANAKRWLQFVTKEVASDHHVLRYETFVADEMTALAAYLGVDTLERDGPSRYEHRRRTGSSGDWKRYFTPSDVEYYRRRIGPLMGELGYTDWELAPEPSLGAATGSDYVRMLIDKARERREKPWTHGVVDGALGRLRELTRR